MNEVMREYLKRDRQWRRDLRIAHARYRVSTATNEREREFFEAVLEFNGADEVG